MSRELRLIITFEGQGSGLENQRLSVDDFAPALVRLQRAYRRIAQGIMGSATDEDGGAQTGRFSRFVRDLAWEIDTISHNSPVQVSLACPVPFASFGDTMSMFAEATMDRAADELVDALEQEAGGMLRNSAVRSYLRVVPPGVTRHTYQVQKLSGGVRRAELGAINREEIDKDYPGFVERIVTLAGVHFPPAVSEVRLLPSMGPTINAAAPPSMIDEAMRHRGVELTAFLVKDGRRFTALRLTPVGEQLEPPTRGIRTAYLEARWREVIRALAE